MTSKLKITLLAGAAALFSAPALAATQVPPAAALAHPTPTERQAAADQQSATGPDAPAVEELVVTARRTAENVQTVPIAISAFSDRTLDRQGARDATDLQGLVPNLNLVQGRGSPDAANIYIRGLGQPDALQTFDPAVGVYIDDVYIARIRGVLFNLYDIDRVEVLRGPQGTLYGKNTIGGALKFISRKPGRDPYLYASAGLGNYAAFEAKATLMGPINDQLSGGISGYWAGHDGYVTDAVNGRKYNNQDVQAIRGQLAWTPVSNFRDDLSIDYVHQHPQLTVGKSVGNVFRTNLAGGVTILRPAQQDWNFVSEASPGLPNRAPLNAFTITNTADWTLNDNWRVKSITAYRKLQYRDYIDIDATRFQLGDVFVGVNDKQTSQELQLNYESGRIKAVGGFYYMHEHVDSLQYAFGNDIFAFGAVPIGFLRPINDSLDTDSYAGYVNVSYNLTDDLRISGGLRYTDEHKRYQRATSTIFTPAIAPLSPFIFDVSDSWDNVSGLASIDWQWRPNVLVYGRFSQGFLSGGFNGRSNNPGEQQPYEPETVNTYELGAKTTWFDRKVRANFTLFRNEFDNFQARVSQSVANPANPALSLIALTVLNAGGLTTQGFEFEGAWLPFKGLQLDTQVGYLDAGYDTFIDRNFISATNPTGDRSFQTPAFSPEWTARVGAAYEADLNDYGLANGGYVTLGGSASYRDRQALAVDNTTRTGVEYGALFQGGYTLYDARLVWESSDRKYTAGFYVKNLGAKEYKTDAQEFSSVAGIQTVYYGAPRTYFFRVTGRFY